MAGMRISEVIKALKDIQWNEGDLNCVYYDDCGACEVFSVRCETCYDGKRVEIGGPLG